MVTMDPESLNAMSRNFWNSAILRAGIKLNVFALLETGASIMADGKVAEIATPPVRAGPGAAVEVDAWATATERELTELLGPEHSVLGGSTHISVRVDPDLSDRLAVTYARSFAAPMMLMTAEMIR